MRVPHRRRQRLCPSSILLLLVSSLRLGSVESLVVLPPQRQCGPFQRHLCHRREYHHRSSTGASVLTGSTVSGYKSEQEEETTTTRMATTWRKRRRGNKSKSKRSLYDVLQSTPSATREELKRQYVKLARSSHPDAVIGNDDAHEYDPGNFNEIASAWKILRDPFERKRYDRTLKAEAFMEDVEKFADRVGRRAAPSIRRVFETLGWELVSEKQKREMEEDEEMEEEETEATYEYEQEAREESKVDQEQARKQLEDGEASRWVFPVPQRTQGRNQLDAEQARARDQSEVEQPQGWVFPVPQPQRRDQSNAEDKLSAWKKPEMKEPQAREQWKAAGKSSSVSFQDPTSQRNAPADTTKPTEINPMDAYLSKRRAGPTTGSTTAPASSGSPASQGDSVSGLFGGEGKRKQSNPMGGHLDTMIAGQGSTSTPIPASAGAPVSTNNGDYMSAFGGGGPVKKAPADSKERGSNPMGGYLDNMRTEPASSSFSVPASSGASASTLTDGNINSFGGGGQPRERDSMGRYMDDMRTDTASSSTSIPVSSGSAATNDYMSGFGGEKQPKETHSTGAYLDNTRTDTASSPTAVPAFPGTFASTNMGNYISGKESVKNVPAEAKTRESNPIGGYLENMRAGPASNSIAGPASAGGSFSTTSGSYMNGVAGGGPTTDAPAGMNTKERNPNPMGKYLENMRPGPASSSTAGSVSANSGSYMNGFGGGGPTTNSPADMNPKERNPNPMGKYLENMRADPASSSIAGPASAGVPPPTNNRDYINGFGGGGPAMNTPADRDPQKRNPMGGYLDNMKANPAFSSRTFPPHVSTPTSTIARDYMSGNGGGGPVKKPPTDLKPKENNPMGGYLDNMRADPASSSIVAPPFSGAPASTVTGDYVSGFGDGQSATGGDPKESNPMGGFIDNMRGESAQSSTVVPASSYAPASTVSDSVSKDNMGGFGDMPQQRDSNVRGNAHFQWEPTQSSAHDLHADNEVATEEKQQKPVWHRSEMESETSSSQTNSFFRDNWNSAQNSPHRIADNEVDIQQREQPQGWHSQSEGAETSARTSGKANSSFHDWTTYGRLNSAQNNAHHFGATEEHLADQQELDQFSKDFAHRLGAENDEGHHVRSVLRADQGADGMIRCDQDGSLPGFLK